MAIREIRTVPDPILKEVSQPVEKVDDDLRALMDDMLDTMYAADGIGLAAIQIGVPKRCLLYTSPSPRDQRGSRMPSSA